MTIPATFDGFLDLIKTDPGAALTALDAAVETGVITFPFGTTWFWLLPRVDDFLDCFEELDHPCNLPFIEMEKEYGLLFQMAYAIEQLSYKMDNQYREELKGFPLTGVRESLKMASKTQSEALREILITAVLHQFDGTWARFVFRDATTK
jgi:hypothetical protein